MSEAIGYKRAQAGLPVEISSFQGPELYHAALSKRGTALLRLNGFKRNERWGSGTMKVFAINNEFGLLAIAIGSHEQEALDNAVDCDCMDSCLVEESERDEDHASLGNASESFDLSYISMTELAPL